MLTIAPTLAIGEHVSMTQRAMPFIFLNMAGEMTYILEQRLIAQKITQQRCRQVLSDILKVVFNRNFLTKLFQPQEQFSRASLREFFEKMAHSSVMRLNETRSMDRLFDMLTMNVKYQMMLITDPHQLIHITMNHLNGIKQIADYDEDAMANVKYAHELLISHYKDAPTWEMSMIRCALLNHFQDLRIRVSQLMRLGLQRDDGRFVINKSPVHIPAGSLKPGTIRYFEKGQVTRITMFLLDEEYIMDENRGTYDLMDVTNRCTTLGDNIFREEQGLSDAQKAAAQKKKRSISGADEAKLLSKLIGRGDPLKEKDNFTLSLFDDDEDLAKPAASSTAGSEKRPRSKSRGKEDVKVKVKGKTLAGAMQEMEIKPKSSATPTTPTRKSRGEQLLKMMDEEEEASKAPPKGTAQRAPRSRSSSRKATIRNQSAIGQRNK